MPVTTDRARELLRDGLPHPITGPDGRSVQVRLTDSGVQLWRLDAHGDIEGIVEQPVAVAPRGDVDDQRYRLLVDGIRLAVVRALSEGRDELYPADLVQPDVLLDPRLTTADDVARVLLDPLALAEVVGPVQVGVFLAEHGLPAVRAATAARLHRFRSHDLAVAREAARELVREVDQDAIPALLATLEGWVGFVDDPVWFTLDDRNAHRVLANAVSRLVGAASFPDDRRRVVALVEAGLISG